MYISYEVMLGWKMMKNAGGQGRARALFCCQKKKKKRGRTKLREVDLHTLRRFVPSMQDVSHVT
jgi:hypothetical protein